jgi:hypothetical protein
LADTDHQRDGDARSRDEPAQPPDRPSPRRRRKLTQRLEAADEEGRKLSGETQLMLAGGPEHTFRLLGQRLTGGGPVREVLALVNDLADLVLTTFSQADPRLASVTSPASIDVTFHVPQTEQDAARAWSCYYDDAISYDALPDTTLTVATVADILSYTPFEAAREARALGVQTTHSLRRLAGELQDRNVSLGLPDYPPLVTPEWSQDAIERIDHYEEVTPSTATVVGVLRGAHSGGERRPGDFMIATDPDVHLDPVIGTRLAAGATIKGELSPQARRQIREAGLWDKHVLARIKVIRRRQGTSLTVDNRLMTSIKPRPGYHS